MRKLLPSTLLSISILLSACGAPSATTITTAPTTEAATVAATTVTTVPTTTATTTMSTTTAVTATTPTTTPTTAAPTTAATSAALTAPNFVTLQSSATSVRLTIPKSALDLMRLDASDLMWQAYGEGISTMQANPDGSLTYTMTKAEYQKLLADIKLMVDEGIKGVVAESGTVIRSIKYNARMTEFQVRVDRKKFTSADSVAVTSLQLPAIVYQVYLGIKIMDIGVVFKLIDNSTGKVFQTIEPSSPGI